MKQEQSTDLTPAEDMTADQDSRWKAFAKTGYEFGKFKAHFCHDLINHMGQGFSYDSFAAKAGTTTSTMKNWEKQIPQWAEAKAEGNARRLLFWEKVAMGHCVGAIKANPAALIFSLKNAFPDQYKDKQELDVKGYSNTVRLVSTGIERNTPEVLPPEQEEAPAQLDL